MLDPARRRPYELSGFPPMPEPELRPEVRSDEPLPPAPVITPDTEFTGALLRAVRESQGITLRMVSNKTKIGMNYLEGLEADDYTALPAEVYVRGFVTEFAKRKAVSVRGEGGREVQIDLGGTARAIDAIKACQNEQPKPASDHDRRVQYVHCP